MNLLLLSVVVVMGAALVLQTWLHHQQTTKWMRSFLDKQGVPMHIMDGEPEPALVKSEPIPRRRISVPTPGVPSAVTWRKPQ